MFQRSFRAANLKLGSVSIITQSYGITAKAQLLRLGPAGISHISSLSMYRYLLDMPAMTLGSKETQYTRSGLKKKVY